MFYQELELISHLFDDPGPATIRIMCGAISMVYDAAIKDELAKYFNQDELQKIQQQGEIVFAYWDKRPLLPIRDGNEVRIVDWGNRNQVTNLPKTGWARLESILEKKWDRYKPKMVSIPAIRGCEKKVWFDLDDDIKAVLIEKDGVERVYMITQAATPEYQDLTKHERMPLLVKKPKKDSSGT